MKLLDKKKFSNLKYQVKQIPFNSLFARAVVENMVTGKIYADNELDIRTAYIVHPYGMTLLLGETNNDDFNQQFKEYSLNTENKRNSFEWMQTFPSSWDNKLRVLFGTELISSGKNNSKLEKGIIELNTRVNFKFDKSSYLAKKVERHNPDVKNCPNKQTTV